MGEATQIDPYRPAREIGGPQGRCMLAHHIAIAFEDHALGFHLLVDDRHEVLRDRRLSCLHTPALRTSLVTCSVLPPTVQACQEGATLLADARVE